MKRSKVIFSLISLSLLAMTIQVNAQGFTNELTFQGLDNITSHSASARAAGNISFGMKKDLGLMFQNPASLSSLTSMQVSIGGMFVSRDLEQEQNYAPVRNYSNLSLLLEGLTGPLPDLPPSIFGYQPTDSVQHPYDNIGPNWSQSENKNIPTQLMLGVPILTGDIKLVAGLGIVEYANLDYYYQNNNILSPSILAQRPVPILRPTSDNDPLTVDWSQSIISRDGSIQGYGFSLAGDIKSYGLAIGFSGLILHGQTNDFEKMVGRGTLTFYTTAFLNDSVFNRKTNTGTSDFSGQEFTISGTLSGKFVSLGVIIKLPTTIKRSWEKMRTVEEMNTDPVSTNIKGEDEFELPLRSVIGLSITPKNNLRIGLEYEYRPYENANLIDSQGGKTSPWLSASLFRVGIEYFYDEWLTLRAGIMGNAEVFEPEGNKIQGEPVTHAIYSVGLGLAYAGLRFNLSYENSNMKYQDIWSTAISKNNIQKHFFMADLIYEIPWIW